VLTYPGTLECPPAGHTRGAEGCPAYASSAASRTWCASPRHTGPEAKVLLRERAWTMWRYREWLPLAPDDVPVSLGEAVRRAAAGAPRSEVRIRAACGER